jgi:hypothetical protein
MERLTQTETQALAKRPKPRPHGRQPWGPFTICFDDVGFGPAIGFHDGT